MEFFDLDWRGMFSLETPLLEIFIRGSITYLSIFILLRFILKRESGNLSMSDMLVVVLLSDAAQNSMAGEYKSITDGIFLVVVIIFWSFILDFLAFHVPFFQKIMEAPPVMLIHNGKLIFKNMRKEFVTKEDIESQLRLKGIDDIKLVKKAYMESDGNISVIKF